MIGATTSQSLDLTLLNRGDMVYGTSTIKVEIGLKIGNTIEYIPLGIYNIDDIEKTDYTIKITAFDNMMKFERNFITNLGDTLTLQQVVNELVRITGVQFTGTLPSYSVKKLEGFSCREVLSYVASTCGGNAVITRDGKFTIVTPKDNNYAIGTSNYFDYKREETKYKIGKISCQVGDEVISKGSLGADSMELEFENPWINATILTDIYNKLNGFEYLGYSTKWQGDLSLDVGDIVTITDKKGVVRKHPILSQKFTYTGGLTSEISAKGENKNKNEFSSSGPSVKKMERVVMDLAVINKALINVAYIDDLTAGNIKFDTASGTIMDLQTLISKFVTGENGQFLNLTSSNVVITDAVIKNLIASKISVADLQAGAISTNKFSISSADGGLSIVGPTMQFKDKSNRVRLQLGQDTQGNFNFILRGTDGTTTLIDHTGIKEKAIADDLIKSNMVAENAIGEKQINYSSLITGLNKDTNTQLIKASKVAIDLTGQSLEVSFNSLKSNVDSLEIGGRNLYKGTGDFNNNYWIADNIQDFELNTEYKQVLTKDFNTLGFRLSTATAQQGFDFSDSSKTWTITAWVKAVSEGQILGVTLDGVRLNYSPKPITTSWNKYSWTFKGSRSLITFRFEGNSIQKADGCYIALIKVEEGTKATDWTPAIEDTEEKIESNTTAITVAQGKIEGLIKDTSITKGDITTLKDNYTSIKATVDGINTTVASHTSSIGSLTSKVSIVESSITQLNNKIALKVEATEVNSIVNSAISGVEIGGRNLARKGCLSAYNANNNTTVNDSEFIKDGGAIITRKALANDGAMLDKSVMYETGKKYVISFLIKAISDGVTSFQIYNGYGHKDNSVYLDGIKLGTMGKDLSFPNDKNYHKVEVYFTSTDMTGKNPNAISSIHTILQVMKSTAIAYSVQILGLKIEEGTKTTNWTPAPEDIDQAISSIDTRLKTAELAITKDAIISTVQATINTAMSSAVTSANNNTTNLLKNYSTITAMNTAITQSANSVKAEVSNTYLSKGDAVNTYATKASLSLTADQLKVDFSASGGYNMIKNGCFLNDKSHWTTWGTPTTAVETSTSGYEKSVKIVTTDKNQGLQQVVRNLQKGKTYTVSAYVYVTSGVCALQIVNNGIYINRYSTKTGAWEWLQFTFTTSATSVSVQIGRNGAGENGTYYFTAVMLQEGSVKSAYSPHPNEIYTSSTTVDASGVTIKNGAIQIQNKAGTTVLYGDSNGNLKLSIFNSVFEMSATGDRKTQMTCDVKDKFHIKVPFQNSGAGFKLETDTGKTFIEATAGNDYLSIPIYTKISSLSVSGASHVTGDFSVGGSKNSLQETKSYGERLINAYETAEYYFGDIGSGVINAEGECIVWIDDILQECINTWCEYHVFTQVYNGSINKIERYKDYFIVYGVAGTSFGWELKAKRLGYENVRLDTLEILTLKEDSDIVEYILTKELNFKLDDLLLEVS